MEYLVLAIVIVLLALCVYLWQSLSFKKKMKKIGQVSDEIIEKLIRAGVDNYYRELNVEDLIGEYKKILLDKNQSFEVHAEKNARSILIEKEMTNREIDFMPIIDEVTMILKR